MPDLTGLPALDVAIGLSFIFLLLSLLASAVQELVASLLALRAKTLERGLQNMLGPAPMPPAVGTGAPAAAPDAGTAPDLVDALYLHPLITSLYRKTVLPAARRNRRRLPSYISPRAFAVALTDTLAPDVVRTNEDGTPRRSSDLIRETRAAVEAIPALPPSVKRRILALLDEARGDIDGFRHNLEAWFDDTMARVSGWYKRKVQLILIVIGVAIAVGLNANTLTMGERLWKDPAVRSAVVAQATSPSVTGRTPGATPQDRLNRAADNVDGVVKVGVPLGWPPQDAADPRHVSFTTAPAALHAFFGWLLTIIAIGLGAPFWFDALSRLSRLRGTGKPETPLPASGRGQWNERVT